MASADSSGLEPMRIVQPLDGPPAGGEWSDGVDEIMDGDLAVMLADVTPASGVVLTPVTNFALRNRTEGTVTILSSLGAWRKLARIRRNPKVSLAFHTRRHGYSNRPEFVLVQGIASFSTTPDRDWLESIDSNWERFMGPRDRGLPWEWWTKAYQWERIGVHIAVERTVTWPTVSCGGAAEVDGSRLAVEPPGSQPAPGKGTGPRIDHRRAARRAARLPDTIRYPSNSGDLESLAEDKVIGLYGDHEGNVWVSLHSMGLNHFAPKPAPVETFRHEPGNANSVDVDFVNAILEDHEGVLWIGNDNGLIRIDRKTGRYTFFNAGLGVKPMLITIVEDPSGVLWIGTFGHGLIRFDRGSGSFKTYVHNPADASSLSNDEVHRLFVDHAGTLWVATDDGLDRFDPATGHFKVYKVDWQSRRSQSYVSVAEDKQGVLWLGTHYSGLHRFDPATAQITVYKSRPNSPNGSQ